MTKTILIIGSSGGLGQYLSRYFSDKGFQLALHYHNNKPSSEFDNHKQYQADITNESDVEKMISEVIEDFGSIDAVINNAGISKNGMSWKTSMDDWNDSIAVNLTGPFLITKHLLPHMRNQNKGRIIFMSSIVAETGFIGTSGYAASKAGLLGLTKTLSKEVANKGITVNSIALGYFNAGMINDVPLEMQEQLKKQIPVGDLGKPDELGALIEYIISDKSSYLTGQTINLNGGLYV